MESALETVALAGNPNAPRTTIMGSGPFRFGEHVKGSHVSGTRFDGYFKAGMPYLDGFRGVFMTQPAAMMNALQGGQVQAEFRGVAQFLDFLRSDKVMTEWAKTTGFLPATNSAFKAMQDEGFFAKNPGRDVPILSLISAAKGENTNGYRFGRWTEIRDVFHEEVERALQGVQTPAAALSNTERRGNALLRAFERTAN
jgi:ABC-type transport system substrate-binding protein